MTSIRTHPPIDTMSTCSLRHSWTSKKSIPKCSALWKCGCSRQCLLTSTSLTKSESHSSKCSTLSSVLRVLSASCEVKHSITSLPTSLPRSQTGQSQVRSPKTIVENSLQRKQWRALKCTLVVQKQSLKVSMQQLPSHLTRRDSRAFHCLKTVSCWWQFRSCCIKTAQKAPRPAKSARVLQQRALSKTWCGLRRTRATAETMSSTSMLR